MNPAFIMAIQIMKFQVRGDTKLERFLPKNQHIVFPHIVFSLEYFPPLNSFLISVRKLFKFLLRKGKINEETI